MIMQDTEPYEKHKAQTGYLTGDINDPASEIYALCETIRFSPLSSVARVTLANALEKAYRAGESDIQKFLFGKE
jgi:hypothetical protein